MIDLTKPDAQRLMAFAAETWERYIRTHTPEQVAELKRKASAEQARIEMMFAGRVRPIIESGGFGIHDHVQAQNRPPDKPAI